MRNITYVLIVRDEEELNKKTILLKYFNKSVCNINFY
jgi:hypothetical protein